MRTSRNILAVGAALVVLTGGAAPLLVGAADHLDSPNAKANHALDITDIYAFDGASSSKTVLVLDVNPLAGVMSGTRFATDAEYRLNIDRTGDAVADDVYTVTFRDGGPGGKQLLTLKKNGSTVLTGKTGNANNGGGAKLFAGVRDDPFFFDLASFLRWRDPDGDGKYTYTGPTTFDGIDFFKGTNVSSIVLEIPDGWLGTSANYWGTTVKNGSIVDRMGKPALNTVFMNPFGGTTRRTPTTRRRRRLTSRRGAPSSRPSSRSSTRASRMRPRPITACRLRSPGCSFRTPCTSTSPTLASRPGPRSRATPPATSSTAGPWPRTSSISSSSS